MGIERAVEIARGVFDRSSPARLSQRRDGAPQGAEMGIPVRGACLNSGAAPATVSGEPEPQTATGMSREGEARAKTREPGDLPSRLATRTAAGGVAKEAHLNTQSQTSTTVRAAGALRGARRRPCRLGARDGARLHDRLLASLDDPQRGARHAPRVELPLSLRHLHDHASSCRPAFWPGFLLAWRLPRSRRSPRRRSFSRPRSTRRPPRNPPRRLRFRPATRHASSSFMPSMTVPPQPEREEWEPADGLERTVYASIATIATSIGFALLIIGGMLASGDAITDEARARLGRGGLRRDGACSLRRTFARGAGHGGGRSREPAGVVVPHRVDDGVWRFGCSCDPRTAWLRGLAVLLLLAPHILGAPHLAEAEKSLVPPDLSARFAAMSLAVQASLWIATGFAVGALWPRLGRVKGAEAGEPG